MKVSGLVFVGLVVLCVGAVVVVTQAATVEISNDGGASPALHDDDAHIHSPDYGHDGKPLGQPEHEDEDEDDTTAALDDDDRQLSVELEHTGHTPGVKEPGAFTIAILSRVHDQDPPDRQGAADTPGEDVGIFAMGCFWGAQMVFQRLPGVMDTTVGCRLHCL